MLRALTVALGAALLAGLPARAVTLRLDALIASAEVESPLLGVEAVGSLLDLRGVARESLLSENFEEFEPARAGWTGPSGCAPALRRDGRGRALHYAGRAAERCVFLVPVEPGAHYAIRRSVLPGAAHVDLAVVESRLSLQHPGKLNHPADLERTLSEHFVSRGAVVRVHRFPRASPDAWSAEAIHVFTTPHTQALVVMLQDPEAHLRERARDVWIDDLAVERLRPSQEQELALLKGATPAARPDTSRGLAKHGQLLPVSGDVVEPPRDANFEYRYALFAPAPTKISYDLHVPPRARLSFSYALHRASRPGDRAVFRAIVSEGDSESELFRASVGAEDGYWREAAVDLAPFAGRRVRLRLETSAPEGSRGYALWGAPIVDTPRSAGDPPNVLLIAVDTLRADRLSAYGHARRTSPHLERLAQDGTLFRNAISSSNWTGASFASLFTGTLPSLHRVVHRTRSVPAALRTLAERFREAGWRTRGIAYKAYLYGMGFERGFDTWFNMPVASATADAAFAKASLWLRDHGDRRFFLFVHFDDPHQPFNQPEPFANRFGSPAERARLGLSLPFTIALDGRVEGCPKCTLEGRADAGFKELASDLYDEEIAFADDRLGRLLRLLRRRGWYDDTIVAFVSDHGEVIFERGEFYGHGRAHLTEEALRVPLVIKPPAGARFARGRAVEAQVRAFDLAPTLLDLAGISYDPTDFEARSLVPAMLAKPAAFAPRVAVSENLRHDALAITRDGFRYVVRQPSDSASVESLFHLRTDPGEQLDVAAERPEVLARLRLDAAEHWLRHRPGRYLIVVGDAEKRRYRVRLRTNDAVRSARSLFGPPLRPLDGVLEAKGEATGPLVIFAELETAPGARVEVEVEADGARIDLGLDTAVRAYPAGALARLASTGRVQARVFETLELLRPIESLQDDPRTLEALEALGYLE